MIRHEFPALSETELAARLGEYWVVAVATTGLDEDELTVGERGLYARLPATGARRSEWLTGRKAVRALLRRLGGDVDSSAVSMPHPRLALSHAGGTAVAVAARSASQRGVGVDIEPVRSTPPGIERFFLRGPERESLAEYDPVRWDVETLRLWTVKEAVFKADLGNRGGRLHDYTLDDARCWQGGAAKAADPRTRFEYRTVQAAAHLVSVARRTENQS